MEMTFTLKDFKRLYNDEKEVFQPHNFYSGDIQKDHLVEEYQPRKRVVDSILNFSKALSVRMSPRVLKGNIVMILN